MKKFQLALFASGNGSNALNLIAHFRNHERIEIAFLLCNCSDAPVVSKSKEQGISTIVCTNTEAAEATYLRNLCESYSINFIVLAGYLRLIPADFVSSFPNKIVNIHPSLLPKYGGKGLYGNHVHQAVLDAKEKESGISIHFVNEHFDEGALIAQFYCKVDLTDTLDSLRTKIQLLELYYYPLVIEKVLMD